MNSAGMNFQQIKLTSVLFGNDYHNWSLCGAYATEDGIELKFKRTKYQDQQAVQDQTYCFTVIVDEQNCENIDITENDFQEYWETVVEKFIINQLNGVEWSECGNDYCVIDEFIRIDEYGELNCEQDCY